jgi:hypothetical protein
MQTTEKPTEYFEKQISSEEKSENLTEHIFGLHGKGDVITRIDIDDMNNLVNAELILGGEKHKLYHSTKTIWDMPFYIELYTL